MSTAEVAARAPGKKETILVCGEKIHWYHLQKYLWVAIAGFFGALIVAGWYFGLFEVNWRIGSVELVNLKPWWDSGMGLIHSKSWAAYRHGYRNLGEPAGAVMFGKTLLVNRKYWGKRLSTWWLLATPVILLAVAFVLITGGVWLLNFGLPHAAVTALAHGSIGYLILGFLIGLALHPIWAPVGSTLQGDYVDRSVAWTRRIRKSGAPGTHSYTPPWVRLPAAPPDVRERWCWVNDTVPAIPSRGQAHRALAASIIVFLVLSAALGFIGHYLVGVFGMTIPYLAP